MAFDQIDDFLGRNNDPQGKILFDEWKVYYDKIVYYGGHIFNDILKKENLGKDDSLPLIMLLRNAIELIDSISVLINNSCSEPARIMLRTLLETHFYCQYLLEKDTEKRSLAFLICHYHQKLDFNYKLHPETDQGKQFLIELRTDENMKNYKFADQALLLKTIKNLEELIHLDLYREAEYQKLSKLNKYRKPKWYEFYGGPTSIAKLAKHLKQTGLYHILYSSLSKSTHGSYIIDGLISPGKKEGEVEFSQIRFPYSAQMVTQFTLTLALRIYPMIIKHHLPEQVQAFSKFYIDEISKFYLNISTKKVLVI